MYYIILEQEKFKVHVVDELPVAIEEIYQNARRAYTLDFHLSDWADDDSDSGWGYCYDNSYGMKREPVRHNLVIQDGELAGFFVGSITPAMYTDGYVLEDSFAKENFLAISGKTSLYKNRQPYSNRYGDSISWKLLVEEYPRPAEYVYLVRVKQADRDHKFTAEEFCKELIEDVVSTSYIEDTRGHFDGAYRVKLKLTPKGIAEPDHVCDVLSEYYPFLTRE